MLKPPRVSPKKEEWLAVEAILESDEYDDSTQAAKAIVSKAYELLLHRDWWAIVWEPEPGYEPTTYLTYGLYSTENAAEKALQAPEKLGLGGGRAMVLPVRSLAARLDWVEERLDVVKTSSICQTCKHQKAAHEFPRRNGHCVGQGCDCRQYVQTT